MKILLIDDDSFALMLLQRQLQRAGSYAASLCSRARHAVDLLEAQPEAFDLVFCDLQMPDMDGIEFIRNLGRIGYRGGLVMVSGEDERILQTARKLAQAHSIQLIGTLHKPVSIDDLRQVLACVSAPCIATGGGGETTILPTNLKAAIAGGQLVNYYQPKVDLRSGALIGVEALVRWQHPQAGLVPPDRFICEAEKHGLMDGLTHAVLVAGLRQARQWRKAGLDLQLAVNISMENLAVLDFPDIVAGLAREAGVPLTRLVLEVTESRLMLDARAPLDIVARLRLKGVGLSIDDFGTGHSSLAQLRDMPFDELKLDRSFVNGVAGDDSLAAIVKAALVMARQLGMKSVAEGVEGRADWDFLQAHGCDVAQGYFIARPMLGCELPAWHCAWQQGVGELVKLPPAGHHEGVEPAPSSMQRAARCN